LSTLPKRNNPHYAAQAILSRRNHSVHEVETKLKRRGFSREEIADAIAVLSKHRLLDDAQFAHDYIEQTLNIKAVGPRWLVNKLRQKGVAGSLINQTLEELLPPEREAELRQKAKDRWQQRHPEGKHDQLMRFLISRGFSWSE
jgi:regulatory protein